MPNKQRLLELALKGLEAERAKIDEEIAQISQLGNRATGAKGSEVGSEMTTARPRKRRRMSAAAKRKISEAMKRRYAAMRTAAKR